MNERTTSRGVVGGAGADPSDICPEVQQALLQAEDATVALSGAQKLHLERCSSCQALRSQLVLFDQLVQEQTPQLPEGFELSLRRRLDERAQRPQKKKVWASDPGLGEARPSLRPWVRWAGAAALILLGLGTLVWQGGQWLFPEKEQVTFHQLRLVVKTTEPQPQMRFDVILPRGVQPLPGAAAALGQNGRLVWQSSLRPGTNRFDLPLAVSGTPQPVTVQVQTGETTLNRRVAFQQNTLGRSATDSAKTVSSRPALAIDLRSRGCWGQRGGRTGHESNPGGEPWEREPRGGQPWEGHPREGQPREGQPREGQPREGQPREGQPREGQPREGHPREGHPREGHPREGQPWGGRPRGGQP